MNSIEEIRALFASQPQPECTKLTPCEFVDADPERGFIRLEFAEQPAFRNHFGNLQGGFVVAMLDWPISCAVFVKLRQWLPTVELKCSFLAPAKIGKCIGEGRIVRAGRSVVFVEGRLWGPDGQLAAHATATVLARAA